MAGDIQEIDAHLLLVHRKQVEGVAGNIAGWFHTPFAPDSVSLQRVRG